MENTKRSKNNFINKLKQFFGPMDLTKGKEWKVLLKFSLPIIFSYLLQQAYTISDAAIVGQTLSASQVAGVNDAYPLTFIFLQFAFGCTAGFSVITSNRIGEKDEKGLRKSFASQIILCTLITIILTALSILVLKPMLTWINVTESASKEVYEAAYSYCVIIFSGIVAQMFYNFICSILRGMGDSITPLVFLFISTILNVCLDLLFIVVFKWGVIGAAVATIFAQALSTIACFIYALVKYKELRLHLEDFKNIKGDLYAHIKSGVPLGLQFSVLAIGIIFMQAELVKFDIQANGIMLSSTPAQNGFGASNKLNNFLMAPFNGLSTAMVSFCGQNLGAKKFDRLKRGCNQAMIIATITCIIFMLLGFLLSINGAYQYLFV